MNAANKASEPYVSRGHEPTYTVSQINEFIKQAVSAEREACAKVCEKRLHKEYSSIFTAVTGCVDAIRARGFA